MGEWTCPETYILVHDGSGTPLLQVGGFYITNIAAWIAWLKYCSFIFYAYKLLLKVQCLAHPCREALWAFFPNLLLNFDGGSANTFSFYSLFAQL